MVLEKPNICCLLLRVSGGKLCELGTFRLEKKQAEGYKSCLFLKDLKTQRHFGQ